MNQRYAVLACAFLWATLTWAQESSSNGDVLEAVFDNYTTSGTKEQTSQLLEAIAASPLLAGQLHELAAAHLFSGIKVVVATPPVGPPFAGLTKGSTIVLTGNYFRHCAKVGVLMSSVPMTFYPTRLCLCWRTWRSTCGRQAPCRLR